jgi:hypothetical protein
MGSRKFGMPRLQRFIAAGFKRYEKKNTQAQ